MQVTRHDSDLGQWEMAMTPPAPALHGLVDTYIGYDERNTSFTRRHELPGLQAVLIVNLGAPISIIDTAGFRLPLSSGDGFGAGLSDAYAISESGGSQRGVQAMFTPHGARRFFGLPMHLLANRVFSLDDLLGRAAAQDLAEQLQAANGWSRAFRLLDAAILARLAAGDAIDAAGAREIAWAVRQLQRSHGQLSIAALAAEIGCSRKHLAAGFREHVGIAPKSVARILRFRRVLELVEATPARWSAIAQAAGYFDQAHFSNDFRQLTGRSPGAYMADRLPGQYGLPVG
jgi:AraC-like DNA-binding protein